MNIQCRKVVEVNAMCNRFDTTIDVMCTGWQKLLPCLNKSAQAEGNNSPSHVFKKLYIVKIHINDLEYIKNVY